MNTYGEFYVYDKSGVLANEFSVVDNLAGMAVSEIVVTEGIVLGSSDATDAAVRAEKSAVEAKKSADGAAAAMADSVKKSVTGSQAIKSGLVADGEITSKLRQSVKVGEVGMQLNISGDRAYLQGGNMDRGVGKQKLSMTGWLGVPLTDMHFVLETDAQPKVYKPNVGTFDILTKETAYTKPEVDAFGKGFKTEVIALPAGSPATGYIPLYIGQVDFTNPEVYISTHNNSSTVPMNNCSFDGIVRAGGWGDGKSYATGMFTIFQSDERALHSCWAPSESTNGYVFYVETRAFPVTVKVPVAARIDCTGKDIQYGTAVFKVNGQSTGNVKATRIADWDKGTGFYENSDLSYNTKNKPTAEDVKAVALSGDTMTGWLTVEGAAPLTESRMEVKRGSKRLYQFVNDSSQGIYSVLGGTGAMANTAILSRSASDGSITLGADAAPLTIRGEVTSNGVITVPQSSGIVTKPGSDGQWTGLSSEGTWSMMWRRNGNATVKGDEFIGISNKSVLLFRQDKGTGDGKYIDQRVYHAGADVDIFADRGSTVEPKNGVRRDSRTLFQFDNGTSHGLFSNIGGVSGPTQNSTIFQRRIDTGEIIVGHSLMPMTINSKNYSVNLNGDISTTGSLKVIGGDVQSRSLFQVSLEGNTHAFLIAKDGDAHMCSNSYWDGTTWRKFTNANQSITAVTNRDGFKIVYSPPGGQNPFERTLMNQTATSLGVTTNMTLDGTIKVGGGQINIESSTTYQMIQFHNPGKASTMMYQQPGGNFIICKSNGNFGDLGNYLTFTAAGAVATFGGAAYGPSFTPTSDIRLKSNLIEVDRPLDRCAAIKAYSYNKIGLDSREVGVVAQDMQYALPDSVSTIEMEIDGEKVERLGVNYAGLTALNTSAINELHELVKSLQSRIEELEASK